MTGPVYAKSDKTSDVQDKIVPADKRENNIEGSVISDGYRDLEEVEDDIHNKNAKK